MARPRMTVDEIREEIEPRLVGTPTDVLKRMITGLHEAEFKQICQIPSRRSRQHEVIGAIRKIIGERKQS